MDPEFFPEPHQFRPERWLEAKESGFPLHKYLVAFSRGHRQCLGMRYVEPRAAAKRWQCTILTFLLRSQSLIPRDVQCSRAPRSQVRHGAPRDDGGECVCGAGDGLAVPGEGPLPGQGQGYAGCRCLVHTRSAIGTAKGVVLVRSLHLCVVRCGSISICCKARFVRSRLFLKHSV
jgi:hypothetical protein